MARFSDPFDPLQRLQQALEAFRSSNWLSSGLSGLSSYPLMNMFRKDDDFIIVTEVPGIKNADLNVEVKGNTIRLAGTKSITYPENASLHRRERPQGRFDRTVTLPFAVAADGVKAECRDGILALYLPRAEHDKPRSIQIS